MTGAESITVTCCPVCSATECAKLLTTETVEAPAPVAICAVTVSPISMAPIAFAVVDPRECVGGVGCGNDVELVTPTKPGFRRSAGP